MPNNHKKKRLIFVSSILTISIIAVIFVIVNFRNNIVFFYSTSELKTPTIIQKIEGKQIRIGGLVVEGSIKRINASNAIFTVTDLEQEVKINYHGILPDLFREGQGVVAKGVYNPLTNEFVTNDLLVKHDEKYMPPEVAKSLK